jgi:hypothetical protein
MARSAASIIGSAEKVLSGLLGLGLFGILMLIVYGNLSGNLGFASGTAGYNNTENVINNLTSGTNTFFGFSGTFFTLTAITLLIGIILIVINMVRGKRGGSSGFSN